MDIGFIGLGRMGFHMARRLVEAKHTLIVHDSNSEAVKRLTALGAEAASSPREVADRAETVMASLPSLEASLNIATGKDGVIDGKRVKRLPSICRPSVRTWRYESTTCLRSETSRNSIAP